MYTHGGKARMRAPRSFGPVRPEADFVEDLSLRD